MNKKTQSVDVVKKLSKIIIWLSMLLFQGCHDQAIKGHSTQLKGPLMGWHEGRLIKVSDYVFRFEPANGEAPVAAYPAPSFFPGPEKRGNRSDSIYWLGAYCSDESDFRWLELGVIAIVGEFRQDPFSISNLFRGEGFYFMTSADRAPASQISPKGP